MGKILFVGHEATRTGAPYVLLHLLRWLRANTNAECRLLLLDGGELVSEFAEVSHVSILRSEEVDKDNIVSRGLRYLGYYRRNFIKRVARFKETLVREGVDLIYSNTAVNGPIISSLADIGCPVITHVHELEYTLRHFVGAERTKLMKECTSHYIAVSESVRKNLIENHSIPEEKIDLIHEFIPVQVIEPTYKTMVRRKFREELGIPAEDYLVGGSGSILWRKGNDLFVQLASLLKKRQIDRPVWFVWLGGPLEGAWYYQLLHDIRLLGLENIIKFLGVRDDTLNYFCALDVFVMTSREDPFPLVCLEAASVGVPIVCFDKTGGVYELVDCDSGFVVPYLDLACMADKVSALLNSEELRLRYGARAAQKTRQLYDVDIAAPKILEVIQRFAGAQQSRSSWQSC